MWPWTIWQHFLEDEERKGTMTALMLILGEGRQGRERWKEESEAGMEGGSIWEGRNIEREGGALVLSSWAGVLDFSWGGKSHWGFTAGIFSLRDLSGWWFDLVDYSLRDCLLECFLSHWRLPTVVWVRNIYICVCVSVCVMFVHSWCVFHLLFPNKVQHDSVCEYFHSSQFSLQFEILT